MESYLIAVKEKGRAVLPVALQRAGKFGPGDNLIARVLPGGGILLETREQVLERIWASMEDPDGFDGVEELKKRRSERDAGRRQQLVNPESVSDEESQRRSAALLALLGLE